MQMEGLISHEAGDQRLARQDLLALAVPQGTDTHRPVSHHLIVQGLIESLGFRRFDVVADSYVINKDANRMFGVLEINEEESGVRFAIAVRNSHDRSFALGLTVGYRVFCCSNLSFHGDFTPVTRKHTRNFDHIEVIDAAVGKMQRSFEPMKRQINAWQNHELPDVAAREVIYKAFIQGELEAPRRLARLTHEHYFEPKYPEFEPRTFFSLSNAFTSAFKELEPVPYMQATAKLAPFLASVQ
jgi:hypothetical protein